MNPLALEETQVQYLDWENPLEEEVATHSSILAWKVPPTVEPGGLQSIESLRVRHDWATEMHIYVYIYQFSSVAQSCPTLRLHGLQHVRFPCPSPACSNSCPSSRWCHPAISSSVVPFSSCLQSFPASGSSPMSQFFTSDGRSIGASALTSIIPWIFRTDFLQDWLVWSPCSPRDSQESSLTPQFKSINSLVLSFLYSPTLTSIHDYWKNRSCD